MYSVGPVGFEASVRVPLPVDFMIHYKSRYKIILAAFQRVDRILTARKALMTGDISTTTCGASNR